MVCPHCGSDKIIRLKVRIGTELNMKCSQCNKLFTTHENNGASANANAKQYAKKKSK